MRISDWSSDVCSSDLLAKLHAKARRRVYLTHLAGGHFIDPAIQQALGRTRPAMPGYIYIINILHGMGIQPSLDYISVASRSEERRVGKEWFSTGRSRWSPYH